MVQWLSLLLMGWWVLGSHLGTGSNTKHICKGPMGRCKATTPSSFSLTSNRVTTNYIPAVSIKISKLLICFCSFGLSCPILEKNIFNRKFVYCLVLLK